LLEHRKDPGRAVAAVVVGALATGAPCSGAAVGQNAPETVVVTATRLTKPLNDIPAAIDVVGKDEVQLARQQLGLDESLVQMPGIFMQDRYNFAQDLRISIRGFGARSNFGIRGVRIFVDGIPETLPDGQGQVDSVDIGSVERITVLRGSASSLYGNASGGVILIDSEVPPEHPMVEARSSFGGFGFNKQQIKTAGTAGKLGYMLNLSDMSLDGYRAQSAVEGRQANSTLRYDFDPSSNFRVALNYTDQPRSDDAGALTRTEVLANPRAAAPANVLFHAGENLTQTRVGFAYDKSFGDTHTLSARNYYVWRTFENSLAFRSGGAVTIDRFFVGGGLSYTNKTTIAGRENRLVVGIDVDHQDDDRRRFDNNFGALGKLTFDQNETVASTGVFLQDELHLRDDLELTLGVRHDSVKFDVGDHFIADGNDSGSRTLGETSPMAALMYRISPRVNAYANVSTSFETPTTSELANPTGGGGFNPNLDPQIATNYEVGVKGGLGDRSHFSVAVFRIDVKDELIPFEIPGSPGRSFYRNAGKSQRKGVEVGFATTPITGLDLSLAYTESDFAFRDFIDGTGASFSGNKIPGLPDHILHGEVSYRHASGLFAAVDAIYISSVFVNNANTLKSDAYTVANARAGYSLERGQWNWSVFGGANNMFDESYSANVRINAAAGRYFEPAPDANFYAGASVRYRFGG
jgi:iron complex outermembrane receptor protein